MLNERDLNKEIRAWEDEPSKRRIIQLWEDDRAKVYYVKQRSKGKDGYWYSHDLLTIELNGGDTVITHKPHLDPYVTVERNIVCMTSDSECWVCDTNTGRENAVGMPIVPFEHTVSFDADWHRRHFDNAFCVIGSGCPWGCEGYQQEFEIYMDKDTLELFAEDVWDEEEGYDEYIKSLEEA